jgi:hypothetical protein
MGDPGPRSIFVQSAQIADLIPRLDSLAERVAMHVLGREGDAPAGVSSAAAASEIDELRRRVELLERRGATLAPAPSQAAKP